MATLLDEPMPVCVARDGQLPVELSLQIGEIDRELGVSAGARGSAARGRNAVNASLR